MSTLFSIGHGARPFEELVAVLRPAHVTTLADIRLYASSHRHPQFAGAALAAGLRDTGIAYVHLPGLGGRRKARPSSPHVALKEPGFRAYADHLATPELARDLARLREEAARGTAVFMCAETLWWRCHRRILADRLVADGETVLHLTRPGTPPARHELWALARLTTDGTLVYDQGELALFPHP